MASWGEHDFYGLRNYTVFTTEEFSTDKSILVACHRIDYNEGGASFVTQYADMRDRRVLDTTTLFLPYRYIRTIQETERRN